MYFSVDVCGHCEQLLACLDVSLLITSSKNLSLHCIAQSFIIQTSLSFPREHVSKLSEPCLDFVQRLICEPEVRLGHAQGAKDLMEHPWLAKQDIKGM
jgi:hypothetical protein